MPADLFADDRPWDEVADQFAQRYPGVDPEYMRQRYESVTNMRRARQRLPRWQAREQAAETGPESLAATNPVGSILLDIARGVPFARTVPAMAEGVEHGENERAYQNVMSGRAEPHEYLMAARHEHTVRQAGEEGLGSYLGRQAMELPAMAGEYMLGGAAFRAIAGGVSPTAMSWLLPEAGAGIAHRTGALAARQALTTPFVPSLWAEDWAHRGGEVQNLPAALGLGAVNNILLGSVSEIAGPVGRSWAMRVPAAAAIGIGEQAAADILTSSLGLSTGYGVAGELYRGEYGQAARHLTGQAMTFVLFSAMHSGYGEPRSEPSSEAAPPPEAPQATEPPGIAGPPGSATPPPESPPGSGPTPTPPPGGPAGAPAPPHPVMQTLADVLRHFHRAGYSLDHASYTIQREIMEPLHDGLSREPSPTAEQARSWLPSYPENSPLRRFADAVAEAVGQGQYRPPQAEPASENAPGSPRTDDLHQERPNGQPGEHPQPVPAPERQDTPSAPVPEQPSPAPAPAAEATPEPSQQPAPAAQPVAQPVAQLAESAEPQAQQPVASGVSPGTPEPRPERVVLPEDAGEMHAAIDRAVQDGRLGAKVAERMRRRLDGVPLEQIGKETGAGREGVRKSIKKQLERLGLPGSLIDNILAAEKNDRGGVMRENAAEEGKRGKAKVSEGMQVREGPGGNLGIGEGGDLDAIASQIIEAHEHGDLERVAALSQAANQAVPPAPGPGAAAGPHHEAAARPSAEAENPARQRPAAGVAAERAAGADAGQGPALNRKEKAALEKLVRQRGVEGAMQSVLANMPGAREHIQQYAEERRVAKLDPEVREMESAAREAGVDPEHLHQAARQMIEDSRVGTEEVRALLKYFREQWPAVYKRIKAKAGRGVDADAIRGMDDIAENQLPRQFRHLLAEAPDKGERLFNLVVAGPPEALSRSEAYRRALDYLERVQQAIKPKADDLADINRELRYAGEKPLTADEIASAQSEVASEAVEGFEAGGDAGPDGGDAYEGPASGGSRDLDLADVPFRQQPGSIAGLPGEPGRPTSPPGFSRRRSGRVDLEPFVASAKEIAYQYRELSGQMFPRTTDLNNEVGERLARYISANQWAKDAGQLAAEKVLGPSSTPAQDALFDATLWEYRARHAEQQWRRLSGQAALQGDAAAATAYMKKATRVGTAIGAANSPLKTPADYQRAVSSPEFGQAMQRYAADVGRVLDDLYTRANGHSAKNVVTQIPGLPFNARFKDTEPSPGGGRGNLRNPKLKRDPFAREASLEAPPEDFSLTKTILNSYVRRAQLAAQHDAVRQAVAAGLAEWAKPGEQVKFGDKPGRVIPEVRPPQGTQMAERGEIDLVVHPDIYKEWRRALAPDEPWQAIKWAHAILTRAQLASALEAVYHTRNMMTSMMRPGMSFRDLASNFYKVATGDLGTRERLVDLALIGAAKEHGLESGNLWGGTRLDKWLSEKLPDWWKKNLPATTDPTGYVGAFLDVLQRTFRLTADDAFQRLRRRGDAVGSETNRRDFINQLLGQYNKRAQHPVISWLRDTGIGPFATAGSQFFMRGLDPLLAMRPSLSATGMPGAVRMRAEMLAKYAAALVGVGLANYLLWKNIFGDDDTPFGHIRLGEDRDGHPVTYDVLGATGLTRGMRSTGLAAVAAGMRNERDEAQISDRALNDIWHGLTHPAMGPTVQFLHTLRTGEDTMGRHIADHARRGESQWVNNFEAALLNTNPVLGELTGANRPRRQRAMLEDEPPVLGVPQSVLRGLGPLVPQSRFPSRQ